MAAMRGEIIVYLRSGFFLTIPDEVSSFAAARSHMGRCMVEDPLLVCSLIMRLE